MSDMTDMEDLKGEMRMRRAAQLCSPAIRPRRIDMTTQPEAALAKLRELQTEALAALSRLQKFAESMHEPGPIEWQFPDSFTIFGPGCTPGWSELVLGFEYFAEFMADPFVFVASELDVTPEEYTRFIESGGHITCSAITRNGTRCTREGDPRHEDEPKKWLELEHWKCKQHSKGAGNGHV